MWPELPAVYQAKGCPEGMVCAWEEDHYLIITYIAQAIRYHQFIQKCPYVKEEATFSEAVNGFLKGGGVPTPEGPQ